MFGIILVPGYLCVFMQNALLLLLLLTYSNTFHGYIIHHRSKMYSISFPISIKSKYEYKIYIHKSIIFSDIRYLHLSNTFTINFIQYKQFLLELSTKVLDIYEASILCVPRSIQSDYNVINAMCDTAATIQLPNSAINASLFCDSLSFLSYSIQSSYPHLRWKDGILTKRNQR